MGILDSTDQDRVLAWLQSLIESGFETSFEHDTECDSSDYQIALDLDKFIVTLPNSELRITITVNTI